MKVNWDQEQDGGLGWDQDRDLGASTGCQPGRASLRGAAQGGQLGGNSRGQPSWGGSQERGSPGGGQPGGPVWGDQTRGVIPGGQPGGGAAWGASLGEAAFNDGQKFQMSQAQRTLHTCLNIQFCKMNFDCFAISLGRSAFFRMVVAQGKILPHPCQPDMS